jgi:hypothetical protein
LWFCGFVVCGFVVLWFCGFVVLWFCGFVVLWFCGFVVLWFCVLCFVLLILNDYCFPEIHNASLPKVSYSPSLYSTSSLIQSSKHNVSDADRKPWHLVRIVVSKLLEIDTL